jgi:GNAT superfamily N-acetyltransferase
MDIYVRRGHHMFNRRIYRVLDVANCEVTAERQNQGVFSSWFTHAEELARKHFEGVFCESIINPVLIGFFERRGYTLDVRPGLSSTNYFKLFG